MADAAMGAGPEGTHEGKTILRSQGFEDFAAKFDLVKIYRGVLRRLWLVIACAVIFTLALGFFARRLQSVYVADAYIMFDVQSSKFLPESFPLGHFTMASAVEMVTLPSHLNAVRSILGLELTEQQLLKMIDVKPPLGDSNLIDITVSADNPSLAMDIANTLASVVVKDAQDFTKRQLKSSYDYLANQAQTTRTKIDQKVKEIASFRRQHSFIDATPDGVYAMKSITDMEKRLQDSVSNYNSLLIEYENLRREAARLPDQTVKSAIEDSPLKRRLEQTQLALLEAKTRYATENPKIKSLEAQLVELQAMLSKPPSDNPDPQSLQQYEPNAIKQQLNLDLVNLRGKVRSAQKIKEDAQSDYAKQQTQLTNLPAEEMEFSRLLNQKTYFEEDLKQTESVMKIADMMLKLGKGDLDLYANATKAQPDDSIFINLLPLIGFLVGIAFGLTLAAFLEITDPKIRTPQEADNAYNIPCLMTIPELSVLNARNADERLRFFISYLEGAIIRYFQGAQRFSLAVTSSTAGEGKSTLTFSLGRYWQRFGKKVVMVEFDPELNPMFGPEAIPARPLEDYLLGHATLDEIIYHGDLSRIKVSSALDMKELLRGDQACRLMEELRQQFDIVLLDTPGVVERDYTLGTLDLADGVLFVIGSSKVARKYVDSSLHECELVGVWPIGLVLNRALSIFIDDVRLKAEAKLVKTGLFSRIRGWFSRN